MTNEERRQMLRNNYAAQMEMLGYQPDGNPKDLVEVVRCKDCKHYMTIHCTCDGCCISDNWFCADGERRAY